MLTKPSRVAIYARYSSAEQRAESIADQVELCKRECERQGWSIVATFSDDAMSGSSSNRPDYER